LALTIRVAVELGVRKYHPPTIATTTIASIHTFLFENLIADAQLSSRHPKVSIDSAS
jgi:hypothetical protein